MYFHSDFCATYTKIRYILYFWEFYGIFNSRNKSCFILTRVSRTRYIIIMKEILKMKNKYKLLGLYLPLFIAAVIGTAVRRTIALFNDFDLKTGYFTDKTLISVGDYIVIGMSILFLTYILTARRDLKMIPDFTSPATYLSSVKWTVEFFPHFNYCE